MTFPEKSEPLLYELNTCLMTFRERSDIRFYTGTRYTRGGQAVTVMFDTLVHALEVAKALIMSPEDDDAEGGGA